MKSKIVAKFSKTRENCCPADFVPEKVMRVKKVKRKKTSTPSLPAYREAGQMTMTECKHCIHNCK